LKTMREHLEGILWLVAFGGMLLATQVSSRVLLTLIGVASGLSLVAAIPLHFWRAWRKASSVPNRREYVVWVALETLFTLGFLSACGYTVSAH